tara:strand:- start:82 stop:468 length:387 start_codon:yes stop_codon:yes gene_type:complete
MIVNSDFKNISSVDIKEWCQHSSLGNIGLTFFSEPFKCLDYELLNFFVRCHSSVDTFFIISHEKVLTEENLKIIALLPYVNFTYSNENLDEFFKYIHPQYFFKKSDQNFPDHIDKLISSLEGCQIKEV